MIEEMNAFIEERLSIEPNLLILLPDGLIAARIGYLRTVAKFAGRSDHHADKQSAFWYATNYVISDRLKHGRFTGKGDWF